MQKFHQVLFVCALCARVPHVPLHVFINWPGYSCVYVPVAHMLGLHSPNWSRMLQNQRPVHPEWSKTGPSFSWTTIASSNSCLNRFKHCTIVGIRADQAAAQGTLRLTVTSKLRGLCPNCLVKNDKGKRETEAQLLPSSALLRAALASRNNHILNKDA